MTDARGAKHAPGAPRTPFVLLVLGLLVGGMFALLALNTVSAANEVARHDLAADDQSAAAQLVELENEAQASAAPANVAAAARALGMVPAGNPGFLEIGRNGAVRVLGRAQQASEVPVVVAAPTTHTSPKPTPTPTPTASPTTTAKARSTSTATPTAVAPRTTTRGNAPTTRSATKTTSKTARATSAASTTAPRPTPTPTPTPNSTLPGGER